MESNSFNDQLESLKNECFKKKEDNNLYLEFLINRKFGIIPMLDTENFNSIDFRNLVTGMAKISPSIALSFSMHLYTSWGIKFLAQKGNENAKRIIKQFIDNNWLVSSLNDPNLYFLNSKDITLEKYPIIAERKENGNYVINGLKKFVSLEPYVQYLPVYALLKEYTGTSYGIVVLLIDKFASGVTVKKKWDSLYMKDTYTNDILLSNVQVPKDMVIFSENEKITNANIFGYLFRFNISCIYYAIAEEALEYIVDLCKERKIPQTGKLLGQYPGVQFSLANILMKLETMNSQLDRLCTLIDTYLNHGYNKELDNVSLITKEFITSNAQDIVNESMKIEGISSLQPDSPLAQLLLDCKAGQFHPPQRDVTFEILAKRKLGIINLRNRWC